MILPCSPGSEDFFLPQAKVSNYYFRAGGSDVRQSTTNGAWRYPNFTDYELTLIGTRKITPNIAYAIDSKIDDGKPNTGRMVDLSRWFIGAGTWATSLATATSTTCTIDGSFYYSANVNYNASSGSSGDSSNCAVRIKTGF